jgi:nicotinamide-nucleotide amidase
MKDHVLPELNKRFTSQIIIHRNIMTYGTFEARLAETLTDFEAGLPGNIKLAYLPSSGVIKLRLTGTGNDFKSLEADVSKQVAILYKTIPEFIYAENEESLEMVIGKLLISRKSSLSTAESCTGGEIAHLLTSVPGSSAYYKGSVIAYDNDVKLRLLRVKEETITRYGAVSEEVVREMAAGAKKLFNTEFVIATSGIAGPDGGTEAKPIGTLWMAVASEKGIIAEKRIFGSDRISNIKRFSMAALNLLRLQIIRN